MAKAKPTAEHNRLSAAYQDKPDWLKWGPYLSERQWGTVREDYSADGDAWDYLPHDQARSRVYRWGEDGLAGISDRLQRICFAPALWNGRDPILKERMFGLAGPEGNHGEDVKELYYYLDNLPTHAYMKHLYKYPQVAYPYADLVETNRNRSRDELEYELLDTALFADNRYFDVFTEYAKAGEEDILIRLTIHNRGADAAPIWVLPTLWFRNLWAPGLLAEKPTMQYAEDEKKQPYIRVQHPETGNYRFYFEAPERVLFTENETNQKRIFGQPNDTPFVKDAFHRAVVGQNYDWLAARQEGTKVAPLYHFNIAGQEQVEVRLRLVREESAPSNFTRRFKKLTTQISPTSNARPLPGCCGASSITTLTYPVGKTATPANRRRQQPAKTGGTVNGAPSTTRILSLCPTSGSTPGTPPGTWPFTVFHWRCWTPNLPRTN
jgi:hypothetical protein